MTTIILTFVALVGGLEPAIEWHRGGEAWRILTCHFTHFTHEQLAWDALAFLALGVACERRNRAAFHATLLANMITIPLAVHAFAPHVSSYRGLSGIDSALFALVLCGTPASSPAFRYLLAIAFAAKIVFELTTNSTLFVSNLGPGVAPVPIAHVAGAITALLVATFHTRVSCALSSSCSSQ